MSAFPLRVLAAGRVGRPMGRLVAVVGLWAALGPPPALALTPTLRLVPPSSLSALHVDAAGDTVQVRLLALEPDGSPTPSAVIELRRLGADPGRGPVPIRDRMATDPRGEAVFDLPLGDEPGDYTLMARIEGVAGDPVPVEVRVLHARWGWMLIIGISGGLALFLFGLRMIGQALERAAGGRLRRMLGTMTASPIRSAAFGAIGTLMVQSSSASTVLLVSFASAGLMTLEQCLGATLGAAVGSTVTIQLITFRVSEFALVLVAAGFALTLGRGRRRRIGSAMLGLGLMFFGLRVMSDAMAPLKGMPQVAEFFVAAAQDPLPALLVATVFTAIVQASAATIGLVLGLSFQGILTLDAAIPFVLGANVGTAATAVLASLTADAEGRRVAWAHAAFRAGGVLLLLPFLGPFTRLVQVTAGDLPRQIANAHTLLNLGTALVFLPTIAVTARIFRRLVPDRPEKAVFAPRSLDPRFHEQPTMALAGALQEVLRMGQLVREMLVDVKQSLRRDDKELANSIRERDDRVDLLDEEITKYLTDLSTEVLSNRQSQRVLDLLFITKDLELIADIISKGLVPGLLRKKRKAGLRFSDEGFQELLDFHDQVRGVVELAIAAVATWDPDVARDVLERKRDISKHERKIHVAHLERLRAGNEESRATTTVHVDAVNDLKRIVSHSARIAYAVLGKVHTLPRDEEVVMGDRED